MKQFILYLFILIGFSAYSQSDYYWVDGTGNWSDNIHWATTSGGATNHASSPTSIDNVIFDANSFSSTGQTVTVNIPQVYFKNMTWTGALNNPTFTNSYTMNISGSLTLIDAMTYNGCLLYTSDAADDLTRV